MPSSCPYARISSIFLRFLESSRSVTKKVPRIPSAFISSNISRSGASFDKPPNVKMTAGFVLQIKRCFSAICPRFFLRSAA